MDDLHKTPKRSSHAGSFHCTPGNLRASATSHTLERYYVDDVRPLLLEDVKRFKLGNLDRYLHRILRAVNAIPVPAGDAEEAIRPTDQAVRKGLQDCLNKVKDVVDTNSAEWKAIQDAFTKYANAKGETERYPHFVNAANKILALLKLVDIEGLRELPTKADEEIQFVVHDPKTIPTTHKGVSYVRKPDIIVAREKFISPLYRPASPKAEESASLDVQDPSAAPPSTATPAGTETPIDLDAQDADAPMPLDSAPPSSTTPADTETPANTATPANLDAQDADLLMPLESVPPSSTTPAGTASPSTASPASLDAQGADPLVHLQSAPRQHLPWEKGLLFMEFKKKQSKGTLKGPSRWNPQIGSAGDGSFEKPEDIDKERQKLLQAITDAREKLKEESSSSAMPSTSQAASSSALPYTSLSSAKLSTAQTSVTSKGNKNKALSKPSGKSKSKMNVVSQPASAAYQQSNKSKRKASPPTDDQGHKSKKVKVSEQKQDKVLVDSATPAAVQLAEYGAEALYNAFGRSHVLGLLVKDAIINIWHFDHEDTMQMRGFDFLKEQHYLFLLLLALQRFNDSDWGFLPGFEQLIAEDNIKLDLTNDWVDNPNNVEQKFNGEKKKMIKPPFGLGGRATGVAYGSVGDKKVVVKLAWPEKNRNREKEFIDEARKRFDAMELPDYDPGEYLPVILAAREYTEFESGPLRAAVLDDESEYDKIKLGSRMPYLIAMPEYEPITTLTRNWDDFMVAFFALFYCHAMLWSIGIRHGDISESNLMWDPVEKKPKLCDFDLSHFCEPPQIGVPEKGPDGPMGLSNTGTWIFMADELLTQQAMEGLVKRVYRHEVEAFVAVLVWIACRYKDGELREDPPLEHWHHGHYLVVKGIRGRTFKEIMTPKAYPKPFCLPDSVWLCVKQAVFNMGLHQDQLGTLEKSLGMFDMDPDGGSPPIDWEVPEDFNDLRALQKKILSWNMFAKPKFACAELFAKLMNERILNPGK